MRWDYHHPNRQGVAIAARMITWIVAAAVVGSASSLSAKMLYVLGDLREYPAQVAQYDIQKPGEMVFQVSSSGEWAR